MRGELYLSCRVAGSDATNAQPRLDLYEETMRYVFKNAVVTVSIVHDIKPQFTHGYVYTALGDDAP